MNDEAEKRVIESEINMVLRALEKRHPNYLFDIQYKKIKPINLKLDGRLK